MSLIPYYLQFVSEICEGKRPLPEGFALHETDDLKKAVELQTQIQTVGIPEFVRRCAARGVKTIVGRYLPTAKNLLVKEIYGTMGFEKVSEDKQQTVFELDVAAYRPQNNIVTVTRKD